MGAKLADGQRPFDSLGRYGLTHGMMAGEPVPPQSVANVTDKLA